MTQPPRTTLPLAPLQAAAARLRALLLATLALLLGGVAAGGAGGVYLEVAALHRPLAGSVP